MSRKRIIKLPKTVMLKCPLCLEESKAIVDIENCPQSYTCPKCEALVRNPITKCCVICAFSNKKCPSSLVMEAKIKGLEIR